MIRSTRSAESSGFVLVGVIMLVLALTILGLSLFSLSSYESQFLGNSVDELQAFHIADGAIERAKFALTYSGQLQSVRSGRPPYVDSTFAYQDRAGVSQNTGDVDWDGSEVLIRVHTLYRGVSQTVQATFDPARSEDYYKRLITVGDSLDVPKEGAGTTDDRWNQDWLNGDVVLQRYGSAWDGSLAQSPNSTVRAVPGPFLDNYWTEHWNAATPVSGPLPVYTLGTPGSVTFYKSSGAEFGLHLTDNVRIDVHGVVVWMFDHGFRSELDALIRGMSSDARLIMIGRPSTHVFDGKPYPIGVWFFGGVQAISCPLILVSDTEVRIEHNNNAAETTDVPYLSIYANSAWILGPTPGPGRLTLSHPQVNPDQVIDDLNALPQNVLPGGRATVSPSSRAHGVSPRNLDAW